MEKPATKNVRVVNRFERGWPVKRATPLFSSFCSDVAKQVARFFVARFSVPFELTVVNYTFWPFRQKQKTILRRSFIAW